MSKFDEYGQTIYRAAVTELMGLPRGSNTVLECPACGRNKLSACFGENPDILLYRCWRSSCELHEGARYQAFTSGHGWQGPLVGRAKSRVRMPPDDVPPGTVILECRGFDGTLLAYQTRYRNEAGEKIVRTWPQVEGDLYHAPPVKAVTSNLWIVEDIASARTLAVLGRRSLALLGTHLAPSLLQGPIQEAAIRYRLQDIIIALDPGAEEQARKCEETVLALATDPLYAVRVLHLKEDIKDMDPDILAQFVDFHDPVTIEP